MWKATLGTVIVLCLAQPACADSLQLFDEGETWGTGPNPSCSVLLGIRGVGAPNPLNSWELGVQVVPIDNPLGTVSVTDCTTPDNYVFSGGNYGIHWTWVDTGAFYSIYDELNDMNQGVTVPNDGVNLVQITLSPQAAVGRFDLFLVPGLYIDGDYFSETGWTSLPWGLYNFDVVSPPGRPANVVASVVFGEAPEPPTGLMLVSAMAGFLLIASYKHGRSRGLAPWWHRRHKTSLQR